MYADNMRPCASQTAKSMMPGRSSRAPHSRPRTLRSGSARFYAAMASRSPPSPTREPSRQMRIRGFPFADAVAEFIAEHDHVFVVEQNPTRSQDAARQRVGIDPERWAHPSIRRQYDHRALRHARDRGEGAALQRAAAAQGRAMKASRSGIRNLTRLNP